MEAHFATTVHHMRYDDLRTSPSGMFILATPCALALCIRAHRTPRPDEESGTPGSV